MKDIVISHITTVVNFLILTHNSIPVGAFPALGPKLNIRFHDDMSIRIIFNTSFGVLEKSYETPMRDKL